MPGTDDGWLLKLRHRMPKPPCNVSPLEVPRATKTLHGWFAPTTVGAPMRKVEPSTMPTSSEALVPTPLVSDNLGRVPGAVGLRPFHSPGGVMAGRALTVRTRPGDNQFIHRALDLVRPGDVIVVDGGGYEGRALVGEIMMRLREVKMHKRARVQCQSLLQVINGFARLAAFQQGSAVLRRTQRGRPARGRRTRNASKKRAVGHHFRRTGRRRDLHDLRAALYVGSPRARGRRRILARFRLSEAVAAKAAIEIVVVEDNYFAIALGFQERFAEGGGVGRRGA